MGSTLAAASPPSALDLLVDVVDDFKEHLADRLLGGVLPGVLTMVLAVVSVTCLYAVLGAFWWAAVLGTQGAGEGGPATTALVVAGAGVIGLAVSFLLLLLPVPLVAGLGRALLRDLEEGGGVGLWGPLGDPWTDLGAVLGVALIQSVLLFAGLCACGLPSLVAMYLTNFALPAVLVHRLGPVAAIGRSVRHVLAEPVWHLGITAVVLGATLVLSNLPLVGLVLLLPFVMAFQLRAYLAVFGREGEGARSVG